MTQYQKNIENIIIPKVLESYNIDFVNSEFFCEATNVFFKAYDKDANVYGLKICQEKSNKIDDNICEAFFLTELSGKIDLLIPEVVLNKDKESITSICSDFSDVPTRVILYKWIEGIDFDENETDTLFYELGKIIAKLHKTACKINIPANIKPKRWDTVFYFRDEPIVFADEPFANKFGGKNTALYKQAIGFADEHLKNMINKYPLMLIHGDINPWNVLLCDKKIAIIDFEDSIFGYPAQDISIVLYYYRYHEKYSLFKESLLGGYNCVLPETDFDEFELEVLMLARRLNFINFSLAVDDDPWSFVNENMKLVEEFMNEFS